MVRDYLAGRTVPYTPPLRFAIIAAAVAMLIAYWLDFVDPERYPLIGYELGPRMDRELTAVNEMYLRFMNLFLLFMIPVTSVLTRGLFRREALTLGEHVVFNAYAFGILTLLLTAVAAPMFLVLGGETTARVAVAMTWIGGSLIGFVVLCMRFFRGGLLRRTALAAIASLGAGIVYGILTLLALVGYAGFARSPDHGLTPRYCGDRPRPA